MLYGPRDIRIDNIDMPDPSIGEDFGQDQGGRDLPLDIRGYVGARKPEEGYSVTIGHEWTGEIVEAPQTDGEFKVGDLVAIIGEGPIGCMSNSLSFQPTTSMSIDPNLIHYEELVATGSWNYTPLHS